VRRPSSTWVDLALALAVATAITIEVAASPHAHGPLVANLVLCLSLAVPLALLRRRPIAAVGAVIALASLQTAVLTPLPLLVTPLSLALLPPYAVAAYGGRIERSLAGLAVCLGGGLLLELVTPSAQRDGSRIVPTLVIVLLSFTAGRAVAGRARRAVELELLACRLGELGPARERLAVAEQRAHVARELHDVVAHTMTVVCLQAGAARRLWWDRPEDAQRALGAAARAARETLGHLRDALDLLEPSDPPTWLGLEQMEALAHGARVAGLNVAIRVEGQTRAVPGRVGLVAYRIVQEALTNAIRYAAPTDVAVHLVYERDALAVDVRDAGRPPGSAGAVALAGSGHGLRGMRERVESCAGAVSFGPLPVGGFAVSARLPLEARA
jgi:signal transduction histidine kinase